MPLRDKLVRGRVRFEIEVSCQYVRVHSRQLLHRLCHERAVNNHNSLVPEDAWHVVGRDTKLRALVWPLFYAQTHENACVLPAFGDGPRALLRFARRASREQGPSACWQDRKEPTKERARGRCQEGAQKC